MYLLHKYIMEGMYFVDKSNFWKAFRLGDLSSRDLPQHFGGRVLEHTSTAGLHVASLGSETCSWEKIGWVTYNHRKRPSSFYSHAFHTLTDLAFFGSRKKKRPTVNQCELNQVGPRLQTWTATKEKTAVFLLHRVSRTQCDSTLTSSMTEMAYRNVASSFHL